MYVGKDRSGAVGVVDKSTRTWDASCCAFGGTTALVVTFAVRFTYVGGKTSLRAVYVTSYDVRWYSLR